VGTAAGCILEGDEQAFLTGKNSLAVDNDQALSLTTVKPCP